MSPPDLPWCEASSELSVWSGETCTLVTDAPYDWLCAMAPTAAHDAAVEAAWRLHRTAHWALVDTTARAALCPRCGGRGHLFGPDEFTAGGRPLRAEDLPAADPMRCYDCAHTPRPGWLWPVDPNRIS